MGSFRYKARDTSGTAVEGQMDAASAAAVADRLFAGGLTPIRIDEEQVKAAAKGKPLFEPALTADDLIMFSRQMYTLSKAGVPIIRAMEGLAQTARNPRMTRTLMGVTESLESGRGLADSLKQHPRVFSSLYVSIVQVGENSGRLDEAFLQIAQHLELDKEMRERVKTAMRYPTFVLVAISVAIAIINLKVIPAFAGVFAKFDAQLPLPTRILIGLSEFTVDYWPLLLLIVVAAVGGWIGYIRSERGRYNWDRWKLRIPKVGDIINRATLARFSRSFAMAMRSGVPLIQSLTVVSRAVDNSYMGDKIRNMRTGIERGESLTRTAQQSGLFTPLVLQMFNVGEETGQVDDMMQEVAEFYEREVDYDLKKLSAYIEPVLIAIVGVMVLILALGVFLPMWDLASTMR